MAQAQEVKDQSMEDILQSIKRIIADEEKEQVTPAPDPKASGSEVLELHDLVEPKQESEQPTVDVLAVIDQGLMQEPEASSVEAIAPIEAPAAQDAEDALISQEVIQSSSAALQSFKELAKAPPPMVVPAQEMHEPALHSGSTVEELVMKALRPELRAWLNTHLTDMVERMVAEEIKKISA
jgi:uncharacterized protein